MPVTLPKRRFTVDEYHRMAETGILRPDERVELIEGEIVKMAAIGSRHAACVTRLDQLLTRAVGDHALVRVQNPVRLSDLSEPEPDLAIVRPRADFYASAHPGPADTLLVVEVAETTVGFDREEKAPLYALAGIPEYWLVDLASNGVDVYRQPNPEGYREVRKYGTGEALRAMDLPDVVIPVSAIL